MENIKLFVTYKNKNQIIKSDIITPIQTGRAIADEIFEDMIGDDEGENISYLNSKYCELSAIYWVWKNYDKIGNPDKIGFMHYRRHFLFGDKTYKTNKHGLVEFDEITDDYLKNDLCDDDKIRAIVEKQDVILTKPFDVKSSMNAKNIYEHYKKNHDIAHYDLALEILSKKYPEYIKSAKEYNSQKLGYFLNMFILKKDIFFDMCSWLFPILEELDEKIDYSTIKTQYQQRAIGFVAERLLGIYFAKLKSEKEVFELPVSYVEKTLYQNINNKLPRENEITVVVASSNEYVPYLSVFLESLKMHTNSNFYYEINILERNITNRNKNIIKKQIEGDDISVCFINTKNLIEMYSKLCANKHFSVDTYARLFISKLLPNKNKCIYLDVDMLVLDDIAKLFNAPLEGNIIGACKDAIMNAIYHINYKSKNKYLSEVLRLTSASDYFQGGVEVMNLDEIRKSNLSEKMLDVLDTKNVHFVDQCVFNIVFKNKVKYFDMDWNYETYHMHAKQANFIAYMDNHIASQYLRAQKSPKIIHYAGCYKPWSYLEEEYAELWWSYARKTPFYEHLLLRLSCSSNSCANDIKNVFSYKINVLKYWKYKFFSNFMLGKAKKRYISKKYFYKEKIRNAKLILK